MIELEGILQPLLMEKSVNPLEPTIFHESWWLEIATAGRYEVAEVTAGSRTIGRMPYCIQRSFGMTSIEMPMLTHFLGPAIEAGEGSPNSIFLKKLAIARELITKLPSVCMVNIKMHYSINEVIAFQEQAFRTSVQFTHEIEPHDEKTLWSNMRNKTRNVIRRAVEQIQTRDICDPEEFMDFYMRNLRDRGTRSFLNPSICKRLIAASIERGRSRIIAAYDDAKNLLAANFYIWDSRSYYFLLTTRALNSGNGTTSVLIWEAIKDASNRKLIFDSDGLNSNGSILFLAGLGGSIKPRYIVSKSNLRGVILGQFRDVVWGKNFFVRG